MTSTRVIPIESGLQKARQETLVMILAGGRGNRLWELTEQRVKPAVPFGGNYRIIDFTLSNCMNSGFRSIGILAQYKSQSLIRHIINGWNFQNPLLGEFIEVIPAQKRNTEEWFEGTADSLCQNLDFIDRLQPENVMVLGGDQICTMDYNILLQSHMEQGADLTVGAIEMPRDKADSYGILTADESGRVTGFEDKPVNPAAIPGKEDRSLASMGIYIFRTRKLLEWLLEDAIDTSSAHDLAHDILPQALGSSHVNSVNFTDSSGRPEYWRDMGTVDSYWKANMELLEAPPAIDLQDREWPIHTTPVDYPPARFILDDKGWEGIAINSLVSAGCLVSGSCIENSILSLGVQVHDSTVLDSVILPDARIESHCRISNAIIANNCVIPRDSVIGENPEEDRKWFHVTPDGVVLVTREMVERRQQSLAALSVQPMRVKNLIMETDRSFSAQAHKQHSE